jgi:hypothetical protein
MTNPEDPRGGALAGRTSKSSERSVEPRSGTGAVDAFLGEAKAVARRANAPRGRLVFALDATMSRQPTWDVACRLQGEMFTTTSAIGGLDVQLVYFRGFAECRASRWVADASTLTGLMTRIACQGGHTQIGKVLEHVRAEAKGARVGAFVLVGDAMEERLDALCAVAGELGLLGVKGFLFQEGHDPAAEAAFREIARLSGGAYARFDLQAAGQLAALLRSAATYAAGGRTALAELAARQGGAAQALLGQMGASR